MLPELGLLSLPFEELRRCFNEIKTQREKNLNYCCIWNYSFVTLTRGFLGPSPGAIYEKNPKIKLVTSQLGLRN